MPTAGWIGVDLDETVAERTGHISLYEIGAPVPKMAARVRQWLAEGEDVRIFTARVDGGKGAQEMGITPITDVDRMRAIIQDWTELHFGARLLVTNEKDCACKAIWDNCAVRVEANTGVTCSFEHLTIYEMVVRLVKAIMFRFKAVPQHMFATGNGIGDLIGVKMK